MTHNLCALFGINYPSHLYFCKDERLRKERSHSDFLSYIVLKATKEICDPDTPESPALSSATRFIFNSARLKLKSEYILYKVITSGTGKLC